MKTWVRQHPYLALALGYVVTFVIITGVWLLFSTRDLVDALVSAFFNTLVYWVLAIFQIRNLRKTRQRLDEQGQLRAFIRYPDALPGSLRLIWNQGIATPGEGTLRFQPAVYDSLEPSGRPTELKVHEILPERLKISGKDRRYLPAYGLQAVTLLTEGGKVQLAASPDSLDKFAEAMGSGSAKSAS
ncbi:MULTISPECIES: hypothetical protein [unclassified Pseudarthrobacter]|uniref:hypothetical protein n=1 Tax=unclassified Pseudarthrobacter TaxID=2647000 RepID=UPI003637A9D7